MFWFSFPEIIYGSIISHRRLKNSYASIRGKNLIKRVMKYKDCSKCIRLCSVNFSEFERQAVFDNFWSIADIEMQRFYLSSLVERVDKVNTASASIHSRRSKTHKYYLTKNAKLSGVKHQVCQGFFLATLDISERFVRTAVLRKGRKYKKLQKV